DLLNEWEAAQEAEIRQKSDLDWIFANGSNVIAHPHGASVQALANCFGLTNLWGSNGEGMTYYSNMIGTLQAASPFLIAGDKNGWIELSEKMKKLKRKVGLGETLSNERGMPGVGVCIWRPDGTEDHCVQTNVGEFLSRPENQSGTWLIDGGWGGPPGPIHVRWNGTDWDNGGFCGRGFQSE
ncbi:MAG: hypothetical protein KGL39_30750, partial [Patescibacteria group bacterium]|nr:hypothetical protein [Patescibacteria group bacterium]